MQRKKRNLRRYICFSDQSIYNLASAFIYIFHQRSDLRKSLEESDLLQQHIGVVQDSWRQLMLIGGVTSAFGRFFYARVFEREPSVVSLFKIDINEQEIKLVRYDIFSFYINALYRVVI